jgi:endo-beta-N-acetylglucosaminidase D
VAISADEAAQLLSFLSRLKERIETIWYDAVTVEGKLEWQNKLTHVCVPLSEPLSLFVFPILVSLSA